MIAQPEPTVPQSPATTPLSVASLGAATEGWRLVTADMFGRADLLEVLEGRAGKWVVPATVLERHSKLPGVVPTVDSWCRQYLCSPHEQLGRPGPVCPYMPHAFEIQGVHYAPVSGRPDYEGVVSIIRSLVEPFRRLTEQRARQTEFLCVVAVFVDLPPTDGQEVVVAAHHEVLKSELVARGMMLGEFYPGYNLPGVRNPRFRAGEAPAPLLALRSMVRRDGEFLVGTPEWEAEHGRRFRGAAAA